MTEERQPDPSEDQADDVELEEADEAPDDDVEEPANAPIPPENQ